MMVTSLTRKLAPGEPEPQAGSGRTFDSDLSHGPSQALAPRAVTARVTRTVTVTVGPSPADYRD